MQRKEVTVFANGSAERQMLTQGLCVYLPPLSRGVLLHACMCLCLSEFCSPPALCLRGHYRD